MYSPPVKNTSHAEPDSSAAALKSRQGADQAAPGFAPPAGMARLQALILNSPRATTQLKIPGNKGPGVVQLARADVSIFGSTHLVAPDDTGSLMKGEETEYVEDGARLGIDPADAKQSARGPHQEINKAGDQSREDKDIKNYRWFKVLESNGVEPEEDSYLRDETFTYVDQKQHLTHDAIAGGLEGKIKAAGKTDAYVKAHGLGSVADIAAGQKAYQDWLRREYSEAEIMDMHRSVGFEYEFATFTNESGNAVPAHVELGKSAVLSPLFGMSFILESDEANELEAVTPPFLVADSAGGINAGAASRIYDTYKRSLLALRTSTAEGTELATLDYSSAGLGDGWSFMGPMPDLRLGKRNKHKASTGYIYSQMNISLTAQEIAAFTEERGAISSKSYATVARVYGDIHQLLAAKRDGAVTKHATLLTSDAVKASVNAANANLSKGLAGLVTIPSILAQADGVNEPTGLFSFVKEFCGLWLKDSIPNIVDNTLGDSEARKAMEEMITGATADITTALDAEVELQLAAMKNGVKEWYTWPFNKDKRANAKLAEYRTKYKGELTTTLANVIARLQQEAPEQRRTPGAPAFSAEAFGDKGLGVRKDTFVNIKSGEDRTLHLGELRNDYAIEKLLGRRQR